MDNLSSNKTFIFNRYCFDLLGHVYQGLLNFLTTNVYDQFQYSVIETYYKAVEMLDQNPVTAIPPRPALSLDPLFPITLDDVGMLLMQTSPAISLQSNIFEPLYTDENIRVVVTTTKLNVPVVASMWFQSIYQALEMQVRLRFVFANQDRWIKPYTIQFYTPLPSIVLENGISINWDSIVLPQMYTPIGRTVSAYFTKSAPMVMLQSLADETTKDERSLPDYKLSATFNLQFNLPTGYIIETLYTPVSIEFITGVDSIGWLTTNIVNLNSYNTTNNMSTNTTICIDNTTGCNGLIIDINNITGDYGIIGNSTAFEINLSDFSNSSNMCSTDITITGSVDSGNSATSLNENNASEYFKEIEPNIWFIFSVESDVANGNVLYVEIPDFIAGLDYVLISPCSQIPVTWWIENINGYKIFINGPIFAGYNYVLYGFPTQYSLVTKIPNNTVYL